MKKSVIILGIAFALFSNSSIASNQKLSSQNQFEFRLPINSPLHVAICKGDVLSVKKIIEYGADVNKLVKDMSPLMLAAHYNNIEIIKILLNHGAEPLNRNEKGFTALNYAQFAKAQECIDILKGLK